MIKRLALILLTALFTGCASHLDVDADSQYDYKSQDFRTRKVHRRAEKYLSKGMAGELAVPVHEKTAVEMVKLDRANRSIDIFYSKHFSYSPLRKTNVAQLNEQIRREFGWRYRNYSITIRSLGEPIESLIPNFYRNPPDRDTNRLPNNRSLPPLPFVTKKHQPVLPVRGLQNHTVALWASHGWYYDNNGKHWSWQRPRLFQSVEDLLPLSFTLQYLIPMLENAGAYVFTPRERDLQTNEVIVDNDTPELNGRYAEKTSGGNIWLTAPDPGFSIGLTPYVSGDNPFALGTSRFGKTNNQNDLTAEWIPEIPETGRYSVQIAYHSTDSSTAKALYTVYHRGGKTEYMVNQQIGGGTWIYLGEFDFSAGINPTSGKVVLNSGETGPGRIISADAIKFGGGMGDIAREGQISRRARYIEAARYYLQYAGIHDTLVYNLNADTLDYTDDYQCRGEWVNYLKGAPYGPNRDRSVQGLGIPIDVSLAFHTDAGIKHNEAVGTLSIYSYEDIDSSLTFPDGMSRLANRDLADILQTQIVDDIRWKYDSSWPRRYLMNAGYSETYRPNVPSALIELLSHQNFYDMQFANDPLFKFDASRSIYKGILKFIATQYDREYVVQPLPVDHFNLKTDNGNIELSWQPVKDILEPTAVADGYIVYLREDANSFDNGRYIDSVNHWIHKDIIPGITYSYKVTAVNKGGESFPSEVLSACIFPADTIPVLIVNGFDRVSAPVIIADSDKSGFQPTIDNGVSDHYSFSYSGPQIDYDTKSPFISNINPGHGASASNYETRILPGNTHDFTFIHGQAIKANHRSFISTSDEAVEAGLIDLKAYRTVDFLLGEERQTASPGRKQIVSFKTLSTALQDSIQNYLNTGGGLIFSGAYIGTDLNTSNTDKQYSNQILKFNLLMDQAVKTGGVFAADTLFAPNEFDFQFNTGSSNTIYTVESPDALLSIPDESVTILRYNENHYGAAIGYKGDYALIVCGFPLETIIDEDDRIKLFGFALNYLAGDFRTSVSNPENLIPEENQE